MTFFFRVVNMMDPVDSKDIPAVVIDTSSITDPSYDDNDSPDAPFYQYIMKRLGKLIRKATKSGKVAILPGSFGPFPRNHSMLTCLGPTQYPTVLSALVASSLKKNCMELRLINTHIGGIYTGDPRLVNDAKRIDVLKDWEAEEMSVLGDGVIGLVAMEVLKLGAKGWTKEGEENGDGLKVWIVKLGNGIRGGGDDDEYVNDESGMDGIESSGPFRGTVIESSSAQSTTSIPSKLSSTQAQNTQKSDNSSFTRPTAVIYRTGFAIIQIRPHTVGSGCGDGGPVNLYVQVLSALEKAKVRVSASCVVGGQVVVAIEDPDKDWNAAKKDGAVQPISEKDKEGRRKDGGDLEKYMSTSVLIEDDGEAGHVGRLKDDHGVLSDLSPSSDEDTTDSEPENEYNTGILNGAIKPQPNSLSQQQQQRQRRRSVSGLFFNNSNKNSDNGCIETQIQEYIHQNRLLKLSKALGSLKSFGSITYSPQKAIITLIGAQRDVRSTSLMLGCLEELGIKVELCGPSGVAGGGISVVVEGARVREGVKAVHGRCLV
jgi:hypothetical protein